MSQRNSKTQKIPMRRCIGCMESKPQQELIRIAFYEGVLSVDRQGKAKGRGVYLCRNEECRRLARKRNSFQRNFKQAFDAGVLDKIFEEIENE